MKLDDMYECDLDVFETDELEQEPNSRYGLDYLDSRYLSYIVSRFIDADFFAREEMYNQIKKQHDET